MENVLEKNYTYNSKKSSEIHKNKSDPPKTVKNFMQKTKTFLNSIEEDRFIYGRHDV